MDDYPRLMPTFDVDTNDFEDMLAYHIDPCHIQAHIFYRQIYNMTCHAWRGVPT